MAYQIIEEHVWVGAIPDRPGSLAGELSTLADAGLDFELVISQREMPGRALLFISPLRTLEEIIAAEDAGLSKENALRAIRIIGPNTPGLGARITRLLAEDGINLHSFSGASLRDQMVVDIAFDNDEDADKAKNILERELNG